MRSDLHGLAAPPGIAVPAVALAAALLLAACGTGTWLRPGVSVDCPGCRASGAELDHRVVLVGDAGYAAEDTPTLPAIEAIASRAPARTTVVYLGDNVYPRGLPVADEDAGTDEERLRAEAVLDRLLEPVLRAGAEGVLVPGNHDWDRGGVRGAARIAEQARYVRSRAAARGAPVRLLPPEQCPGPVTLDRGSRLRVVVIDTEWLIGEYPGEGREDCPVGPASAPTRVDVMDAARFWSELDRLLQEAGDRHVLLVAHHPPRTRGAHGGFFTLSQAIFPFLELDPRFFLPIPMLYPLGRYAIVRPDQDLVGDAYGEVADRLVAAARRLPGPATIVASGHEHSLQVLEDRERGRRLLYLVSGGGSEALPVGRTRGTLYKASSMGLMVVDYRRDGRVWLEVVETPREGPRRVAFSFWAAGEAGEGAVRPAPARGRRSPGPVP